MNRYLTFGSYDDKLLVDMLATANNNQQSWLENSSNQKEKVELMTISWLQIVITVSNIVILVRTSIASDGGVTADAPPHTHTPTHRSALLTSIRSRPATPHLNVFTRAVSRIFRIFSWLCEVQKD